MIGETGVTMISGMSLRVNFGSQCRRLHGWRRGGGGISSGTAEVDGGRIGVDCGTTRIDGGAWSSAGWSARAHDGARASSATSKATVPWCRNEVIGAPTRERETMLIVWRRGG